MTADRDPELTAFEQRTRALLQQSADDLPGAVRSRLTQARYAALATRPEGLGRRAWRWAPAGALAAAALAVLVVVVPHGAAPPLNGLSTAPVEDIAMLTDTDAMPFSGDQDVDYDFYEWAAGEADSGSSGASVGT